MFASRISLRQSALLCRSLGTMLHSGLPIIKAFDMAAAKAPDPRLRAVMRDVVMQLQSGEGVATALGGHTGYFPELMIDMVSVAEQTGSLPEVLRALAEHYENNLRLRRDFLGQIALPVIQFIAAVFIVAGMIWLLGIIAPANKQIGALFFGMTGTSGALKWLLGWAMVIVSIFVAYRVAAASLSGRKYVHSALLNVPVVGGCMRAFAIARFSWAFHLTQEAGMAIDDSLDASLKATANGAFIGATGQIVDDVMEGQTLTDALQRSDLFPDEFVQIVHVAETSGTVPEALHRLSPQFEEQARRSLRALAVLAGWLVWMMVAAFIIFLIFRIALWYVGLINAAARGDFGE
jgi:type IV pilus assembly protein PilC